MRAFPVARDVVLLGDMVVHSPCDESRVRCPLTADEKMVSWQERLVYARELFSRSERGFDARNHW